MEYGSLVRDAWRLTWRHRFLWLIGLFAGGLGSMPGGGQTGWRVGPSGPAPGRMGEVAERWAADAAAWVAAHAALVGLLLAVVLLLGLGLLALSLVAQGAMARATTDLAEGRPTGAGAAWRAGLRLVWRYAGLWLTLVGAAIAVAALVGALVAIGGFMFYAAASIAVVLLAVVGLPLLLAAIAAGVGASIVVAFAQRAIAVEDLGPLGALGAGWRLLRAHLGESLVTWLIALALGIGTGLAAAFALGAAFVVLGGLGVGVWAIAGLTAPTAAYGVLAGLALLGALLLVVGVANTFLWNYWTLAYLRLSGRGAAA